MLCADLCMCVSMFVSLYILLGFLFLCLSIPCVCENFLFVANVCELMSACVCGWFSVSLINLSDWLFSPTVKTKAFIFILIVEPVSLVEQLKTDKRNQCHSHAEYEKIYLTINKYNSCDFKQEAVPLCKFRTGQRNHLQSRWSCCKRQRSAMRQSPWHCMRQKCLCRTLWHILLH